MMQEYKDLVIQAKNDSKYMQSFLCIMEPLVKSYAKKIFFLDWDDATQELNLAIIEAVKTIATCEDDYQCLKFITNSVKYKFAHLCKRNLKKEKYECAYMDNEGDLQESYRADYSSVELAFDLKNITLKMTSNQRDILKYLILGWSDSEIASFLHFSRQYVNREKKKIYQFLK